MRKLILILFLLISGITYAANITSVVDASGTPFINTRSNTTMLNISIFANETPITIDAINITAGNTTAYISSVRIINSAGVLLGINSTLHAADTLILVNLSTDLILPAFGTDTILIVYEISSTAESRANISANITSTADFIANTSLENSTRYVITSGLVQIQDVYAEAAISPRIVDTNVVNQSFMYILNILGSDDINQTIITIPSQYQIVEIINVTRDGSSCISGTITCVVEINSTLNTITLNITGAIDSTSGQTIIINFTLNTSSSATGNISVNSTITGSNLTLINSTLISGSLETKQLLQILNVEGTKTAALPNGTDYWEFNFTINITGNVTGHVEFKMNNWNNSQYEIMNLTNQTTIDSSTGYFATFYRADDGNSTFNATTQYNTTMGFSISTAASTLYYFTLKMIIPDNTFVSSSWWTTYSMLFRSGV